MQQLSGDLGKGTEPAEYWGRWGGCPQHPSPAIRIGNERAESCHWGESQQRNGQGSGGGGRVSGMLWKLGNAR